MKKLLVLLMILGLATSAQASLLLSLSSSIAVIGGDVTVSIFSTDDTFWTGDFVLSEDLVNWTYPVAAAYDGSWTITSHAGDQGYAVRYPGYDASTYKLNAAGTSVLPTAGTQFSINIKVVAVGMIYIDLQDDATGAEMSTNGPLTLIEPEPMTMALLGLGGLFLRRRR